MWVLRLQQPRGADRTEQARDVDALLLEMELWAARPEVAGEQVIAVFVGGGTPTLLEGEQLSRPLTGIRQRFNLAPDAEVTIEGNPGTVDVEGEKLQRAFDAGANRISLGVQARQRHLLERLGRIHDALQVEEAVAAARRAGFTNINLDLMYGLPGQTPADFRETVAWALSLDPTHISAYSLILEEGTPFYLAFEAGRLHLPPEEAEEQMFREGKALLEAAGFEHYEISNYALSGALVPAQPHLLAERALPGARLRRALVPATGGAPGEPRGPPSRPHGIPRSGRQRGGDGAGPAGARHYRFWNLKHPGTYRAALERGVLPVEAGEAVGRRQEMAETMFMGLRLLEGVSDHRFAARFGVSISAVYGAEVERLQRQGLVEWEGGALRLTPWVCGWPTWSGRPSCRCATKKITLFTWCSQGIHRLSSEIAVQFMVKGQTAMRQHTGNTCRRCGRSSEELFQMLDNSGRWAVVSAACACGHPVDRHPHRRAEPLRRAGVAATRLPAARGAGGPDARRAVADVAAGRVLAPTCSQSGTCA